MIIPRCGRILKPYHRPLYFRDLSRSSPGHRLLLLMWAPYNYGAHPYNYVSHPQQRAQLKGVGKSEAQPAPVATDPYHA